MWDGAAWSPIRAAQQRVVLAILLAEAGHVVGTERLVDEIWGERPPRAAVGAVQDYVMRLRRVLGSRRDGPLVTRGRGYELVVDDGEIDAKVFERLAESGRRGLVEGRLERAVAQLTDGLALWQGAPLADVPPARTVAAEAARLEQRRLTATEDRLSARLELRQHAEVVTEVATLVTEYPLRERLHGQLMQALYRCGRRAEALAAYGRARQLLVDELGLEPGPELRELHRAVLDDDLSVARTGTGRPRPVVPAQLPPDIAGFTGRDADLERLDALLDRGGALVVSTIAGTAGVGKTALAVHWAHRVRDQFPDGQLYVNLRGYAAGSPLRPVDALARFLPALGVPADEVPAGAEDAAGLYRSVLAERRVLVLLDNAGHPDQVRPLLPGSPGCLVLVTSRDKLGGLVARDGAVGLPLDVLSPAEARTLLAHLTGAGRVDREESAAAQLAELCGHLPLALRIAAANLTARPRVTIARYAEELAAGDRLAALQVDGDPHAGVRVAFDHSYAALTADARRLFRLLGPTPGADIGVPAAAALADLPTAQAAQLLDRLAAAHLIEEHAPGRYAFHDLLRRYAADRAATEDDERDRTAALARLYDFYLHGIDGAARRVYPQILRLPLSDACTAHPTVDFTDTAQASGWLDAERSNLVSAVGHAARRGPPEAAWRLADGLRGYLYLRMYTVDGTAVAAAGLAAAEREGNVRAQAASQLGLATLHWIQGKHQDAIDAYRRTLELTRRAGWAEGESTTLGNLGNVHWSLGELREAADRYTAALAVGGQTGRLLGQAIQLGNLGLVYWGLGQLQQAADHLEQAISLYQEQGSLSSEARTLAGLGEAYRALGRLDDASNVLTRALHLHQEVGDRVGEADAIRALADVHREAGRYAEANELVRTAVAAARDIGDRRFEADALAAEATIHHHVGDLEAAVIGYRRAVVLAREATDSYVEAEVSIMLAGGLLSAGQLDRAAAYAEEALATTRKRGYRMLDANALTTLAAIQLRRGEPWSAAERADQALAGHTATGHRLGQARTHLVLWRALSALGRDADEHREQAETLFAAIGAPMADHVRLLLGR